LYLFVFFCAAYYCGKSELWHNHFYDNQKFIISKGYGLILNGGEDIYRQLRPSFMWMNIWVTWSFLI